MAWTLTVAGNSVRKRGEILVKIDRFKLMSILYCREAKCRAILDAGKIGYL